MTPEDLESIPETSAAERAVADLLPIDAGWEQASAALERVPLWFHTFSLDGAGVYTPGIARDHRYRLRAIPEQLTGARVLDVGTFDGFYAFLAERRGAARVVAVDNEQYVAWIRARFGIELEPGAGFRAIAELLNSGVAYRRLDALEVGRLGESFDVPKTDLNASGQRPMGDDAHDAAGEDEKTSHPDRRDTGITPPDLLAPDDAGPVTAIHRLDAAMQQLPRSDRAFGRSARTARGTWRHRAVSSWF